MHRVLGVRSGLHDDHAGLPLTSREPPATPSSGAVTHLGPNEALRAVRAPVVLARMPRLALILLVALASCKKPPATTSPIELATEEIVEGDKKVKVEIGYLAAPEREVEIVVHLQAIGIEEMDKLVVDITVDGFVLVAGEPEWTGFVAPRIPIRHKASFRMLEGAEAGTLNVKVSRSDNSQVLLERALAFVGEGDRVRPNDEG